MQKLDKRKIFWHSRRGMLELDLLLIPFVTDVYSQLCYQEQLLYSSFLGEEDQDLYAWIMGISSPKNKDYENLVTKILAHSKGLGENNTTVTS